MSIYKDDDQPVRRYPKEVPVPERPKIKLVKEDYKPIKAIMDPHPITGLKAKWESYSAYYSSNDEMTYITVKDKDKVIAELSRTTGSFFKVFEFNKCEMDDLNGIYRFLKERGINFKKI